MVNVNDITIKTLCENTAATAFVMAEWGLSIYIEVEGKKILFDTGAGNPGVLLHNMNVMGVKAKEIEQIVLSHGHQDHTGGLRSLLERMHYESPEKEVDIICHPDALQPKYIKTNEKIWHFGCPHIQEELERFGAVFNFSKEPTWLSEDIVTSGEVPMNNDFESVEPVFYLKERGEFVQDNHIMDDQALFIKTHLGVVIISGCAHRGIINTVQHAQDITGIKKIYMVIGGTHLARVSEYRMAATVKAIKRLGIKKLGVSHCTGLVSGSHLSAELGREIFFNNNAGSVIRFSEDMMKINQF